MSDETVTVLLERLSSGRVDVAWSEFLARYSPLIMHVIRRHELDHDRATQCFLHVCGALSEEGFRRLGSFRARSRVASVRCGGWRASRNSTSRSIAATACTATPGPRFPALTEATVAEINARVFGLLTPQQRWHLSAPPAPGPGELAADRQGQQRLQDASATLPADQRQRTAGARMAFDAVAGVQVFFGGIRGYPHETYGKTVECR